MRHNKWIKWLITYKLRCILETNVSHENFSRNNNVKGKITSFASTEINYCKKGKSIAGNSIKFDFFLSHFILVVVDQFVCLLIFDLFPPIFFSTPFWLAFEFEHDCTYTRDFLLRAHENINFNMLWHVGWRWSDLLWENDKEIFKIIKLYCLWFTLWHEKYNRELGADLINNQKNIFFLFSLILPLAKIKRYHKNIMRSRPSANSTRALLFIAL